MLVRIAWRLRLELVLRGELEALVGVRGAVLVLELAPEDFAAGQDVLRRVPEEVGRPVATRLEGGIALAVEVVLLVLAVAERARVLRAPVMVVIGVPADRFPRFALQR